MTKNENNSPYTSLYFSRINEFKTEQLSLIQTIESISIFDQTNIKIVKSKIASARLKLKALDFWLRYLEPVTYKKINGPLPIEWETEVFEKFEKPYKREGAGLTLAELYLDESNIEKVHLLNLLHQSDVALKIYKEDSITGALNKPDHFFFANRLFLLNLGAIYTTGFECPNTENIITELQNMLEQTKEIYVVFNQSVQTKKVTDAYLLLFDKMLDFVKKQSKNPTEFDHYHFIKDYVNPLFGLNQQFIRTYQLVSKSFNNYTLNNHNNSIFDKSLYKGQNRKGIYSVIDDNEKLEEIKEIGKLLFFDPILSGNGKRSCATCHNPSEYFTENSVATSLAFNEKERLSRNTPTLLNVVFNHLLMLDGKHITLQNQGTDVIMNPMEMGCPPDKILSNVMSCKTYKKAFQKFIKLTPNYPEISISHVVSAITLYYSDFSDFSSTFDRAMDNKDTLSAESIAGFNLFMSKAQCATCHFVPQFNGVKPPYISSEFEVLGVPSSNSYQYISNDLGRYKINEAPQTKYAFRTGSVRNAGYTMPYMHNGVFKTLEEVIDFYNDGGGIGKGLKVENQTLSSDSLHLTDKEKTALKTFIISLNENINFPKPPDNLPPTKLEAYKNRKVGGNY